MQDYKPTMQRIYKDGVGFVPFDPRWVCHMEGKRPYVYRMSWTHHHGRHHSRCLWLCALRPWLNAHPDYLPNQPTSELEHAPTNRLTNHRAETADQAEERLWAEEQLRAERKKNMRLGIVERLDVTMARVHALHHQLRVQPAVKEHQVRVRVCVCARAHTHCTVCTSCVCV